MTQLTAGELPDTIRIERPVTDEAFDGAGSGRWELVEDEVWAGVVDMLPSRGEKLAEGINVAIFSPSVPPVSCSGLVSRSVIQSH